MPLDPIYMIGSAVMFATYGRRLRPLVAIFVACTAADLLARSGRIAIWRRSKDPPETLTAPGYSTHAPVPFDGKTITPRVTPRW